METIVFTTKERSYSYQEKPLNSMFGVDLCCNKFTGETPLQIGYLFRIRALNLSHDNLKGSIPPTFSNLKQIKSLDLYKNKFNGKIPPQLVELIALAVFSVVYNNLSDKIPEWTAQFTTLNESSYKGNLLLCGLPLPRSCNENRSLSSKPEDDDNCFVAWAVSTALLHYLM
ncbi:hypothetical protein WN944_010364 [Citrus x changshan-huyou]|uniref:Uncharacterized protein n=1 Tax=Citrus x changshan-huyou TaxID=2935761 RepID=A0AAP0MRI6_9ROSI